MGSSAPSRPSNAAPMVDQSEACEVLPRLSAVLRGATRELDTVRQQASVDPNTWRRLLLLERAPKRLPRVLTSRDVVATEPKIQAHSPLAQCRARVQEPPVTVTLTKEEQRFLSVFERHGTLISARVVMEETDSESMRPVRRVLHKLCIKGRIRAVGSLGFELIARGEK